MSRGTVLRLDIHNPLGPGNGVGSLNRDGHEPVEKRGRFKLRLSYNIPL